MWLSGSCSTGNLLFKQGSWTILLCFAATLREPRECITIDRGVLIYTKKNISFEKPQINDLVVGGIWKSKGSGFETTLQH